MKQITHNGVTYEVEDGWEGMETCPLKVNVMFTDGRIAICEREWDGQTFTMGPSHIPMLCWRPIVAPKVVEPVRRFVVSHQHSFGWCVADKQRNGRWMSDRLPTRAAAEEIAAIYEREYQAKESTHEH